MSLDDVVNLTITTSSATPSKPGFGVPLLMVYHTVIADRLRYFSSPKELTDAGFATTDVAYRMALKVFSQNPRPTKIALGRRALPFTQTLRIYPVDTTAGNHYVFTVVDTANVVHEIDYTILSSATVATIATALAAAITGTGLTVTATSTYVQIVATAGKMADLKNLPGLTTLTVKDFTADPGIATDLTAVENVDAQGWYGIALDSNSKAEIIAAAAWVEARRKLLGSNTTDSEVTDVGVTNDVESSLKTSGYARTYVTYIQNEVLSWEGLAWMSAMLPTTPGSATWAYKTLRAVAVDSYPDGVTAVLEVKRANYYTLLGGLSLTQTGKVASNEWIDVIVFVDWLYVQIQYAILGALANLPKIPFTDDGVAVIRSIVDAQLKAGVRAGGLAASPAPLVVAPLVKDVDPIDRGNRKLPDVKFTATLAGAIHRLVISGTVSV